MALKFRHQGEIFMVEGNINASTRKQFKNHLEFLLLYCKSLTLNMDGVNTIDENGIRILRELYNTSLMYNKSFAIIGEKSKNIHFDFNPNLKPNHININS
jgi:anti-anti-sigma regulatory factor